MTILEHSYTDNLSLTPNHKLPFLPLLLSQLLTYFISSAAMLGIHQALCSWQTWQQCCGSL